MLGTGFFHADPHAGNLLVTDDGVLTYLDFGMMSFLEPAQRYAIIEAVVHMVNRDFTALSDLYGRMGFIPPDEDVAPIAAALNDALPDVLNDVAELNFGVINKLSDVMYKYPFSGCRRFIAVIRPAGVLEGVAMEVDNSSRSSGRLPVHRLAPPQKGAAARRAPPFLFPQMHSRSTSKDSSRTPRRPTPGRSSPSTSPTCCPERAPLQPSPMPSSMSSTFLETTRAPRGRSAAACPPRRQPGAEPTVLRLRDRLGNMPQSSVRRAVRVARLSRRTARAGGSGGPDADGGGGVGACVASLGALLLARPEAQRQTGPLGAPRRTRHRGSLRVAFDPPPQEGAGRQAGGGGGTGAAGAAGAAPDVAAVAAPPGLARRGARRAPTPAQTKPPVRPGGRGYKVATTDLPHVSGL